MTLHLPFRHTTNHKPSGYSSYETFLKHAAVKLGRDGAPVPVSQLGVKNQSEFEKVGSELEEAVNRFEEEGVLEDAWALVGPETGLYRSEDSAEIDRSALPDVGDDEIPELTAESTNVVVSTIPTSNLCSKSAIPLLRKMNSQQSDIFYIIRQWCLDRKQGRDPPPFHPLVHGGGGIGKSHLIKCVTYEAQKILRDTENPDDCTILVSAFTEK